MREVQALDLSHLTFLQADGECVIVYCDLPLSTIDIYSVINMVNFIIKVSEYLSIY